MFQTGVMAPTELQGNAKGSIEIFGGSIKYFF